MAPMNQLNTSNSVRNSTKTSYRPTQKAARSAFGIRVSEKSGPTTFGEDFLSEHSISSLQAAAVRSANGTAQSALSPQCCGFPS